MRLLLHRVKGPTSFASLKTFNGQVCETFMQTCQQYGLLHDDAHWDETLTEAVLLCNGFQLRNLFAIMLQFCGLSNPLEMWEKYKADFSEDLIHRAKTANSVSDAQLPILEERIYNVCLVLIENQLLQIGGQKLENYCLPSPIRESNYLDEEVTREMAYHVEEEDVALNETKLLPQQKHAFDLIYGAVQNSSGGLFFIDAPGGTGKTFLLNLLLCKVRLNIGIALATASSGIASTLLIGGRTAHSTFKLPFNILQDETPMCKITKQSSRGKLLQETKLIVWDECTMSHKKHLESLDRSLQDLKCNQKLMGGITVVLAGDFRQTLPVITRGTKADELRASLKSSYLWDHVQSLALKTNMRAIINGDESASLFSKQLLTIGDGKLDICEGLHKLPCGQMVSDLHELFSHVFPNVHTNFKSHDWLCERAILAPRNDTVDGVNRVLLQKLPGEESAFLSNDTVDNDDEAVNFPTEFLNSLNPPGIPPHKLVLKTGAPVMLLRNLDPPRLCNGTRLVVRTLNKHVIEATIIIGTYSGTIVAIPRIPMIPADMPFSFRRLQFPLRLSFAMSINKSQGQSLKVVGLHLEKPCFTHGQLYVGCSRVGSGKNLFVFSPKPGYTENIVYAEALENDRKSEMHTISDMTLAASPMSQLDTAFDFGHSFDLSMADRSDNISVGETQKESDIARRVFQGETTTFHYCPVGEDWQRMVCAAFQWPFHGKSQMDNVKDVLEAVTTSEPKHQKDIDMDGNCWYRAIAYLATGDIKNFLLVKRSILEFMRYNSDLIQQSFERSEGASIPVESGVVLSDHAAQDYINSLAVENEWADQIAMEFTSCMLRTPYYLYQVQRGNWTGPVLTTGHEFWEQRHLIQHTNDLDFADPEHENKGIYLIFRYGNHFEPAHAGLHGMD